MAMLFIAASCSGHRVLSTVERPEVSALLIHRRSALGRRSLGDGNKYSDFVRILEPECCSASRGAASVQEWEFGFRWIVLVGTMVSVKPEVADGMRNLPG
jgi:hypothetical protein